MSSADLAWTPATELSGLIRGKQLSPIELTRAVLDRIERLNPTLNVFCALTAHRAVEAARHAEDAVMRRESLGRCMASPSLSRTSPWWRERRSWAARTSSRTAPRRSTPPSCAV